MVVQCNKSIHIVHNIHNVLLNQMKGIKEEWKVKTWQPRKSIFAPMVLLCSMELGKISLSKWVTMVYVLFHGTLPFPQPSPSHNMVHTTEPEPSEVKWRNVCVPTQHVPAIL